MTEIEQRSSWDYPTLWREKDWEEQHEFGWLLGWKKITSKTTNKYLSDQIDKFIKESGEGKPYYLLLYSYSREDFFIVEVSPDPDTRSLYKMTRRLVYNSGKFEYFITLTFPDKSKGKYPNGIPFQDKKTLLEIKNRFTFSGYMRKFWNKIQQNRRNHNKRYPSEKHQELVSYFWKYEQGNKTNRPHVHAFIGNLEPKYPFVDNLKPVFSSINGITTLVGGYLPAVPINLHDELMRCWDSGFIQISPISTDGVKHYAGKYFSKFGSCNRRLPSKPEFKDYPHQNISNRKGCSYVRRWGTSRDIRAVPKNDDILFIEKDSNVEYLIELMYTIDYLSYLPYGTPVEFPNR